MYGCLSQTSLSFGNNDSTVMNQSPSPFSSTPFGQPPQLSSIGNAASSKIDLFNGLGNYGNQFSPSSNQPYSQFNQFMQGSTQQQKIFQQSALAQYQNSSTTPLGFADNEFPSLGVGANRGSAGFGVGSFGQFRSSVGVGRAGYANLIKQQTGVERSQPEFQMLNEDFPALPKAQSDITTVIGNRSDTPSSIGTADGLKSDRLSSTNGVRLQSQQPQATAPKSSGMETHPDGTITGIPPGLLSDQFGMAGLLTLIRTYKAEPAICSYAMGQDLTRLGVNLNTPQPFLYEFFGGPFSEQTCRPQDIDCQVPPEYLNNNVIGDNLAPMRLNRYGEDLLFYLFYNFGGELFQLAAAAELYNRDWRYHKEERIWVARAPGVEPTEKTQLYEKGTYYVFDPGCWRKVQKEMHLEYSKLEDRPVLPPQQQQTMAAAPVPGHLNIGLSGGMHNS